MNRSKFSACCLRYVHDLVAGEALNVGVLLFCPEKKYVNAVFEEHTGRLSAAFAGFDATSHKRALRNLVHQVHREAAGLTSIFDDYAEDFASVQRHLLPDPNLSIQFGPEISGITTDPVEELHYLMERMVLDQQRVEERHRRDDDDVWGVFKAPLQERSITSRLEPVRVKTPYLELDVPHAFRNGALHLLQPVSLDLGSVRNIDQKVSRWVGNGVEIQRADEPIQLYLLLGRPTNDEFREAYRRGKARLEGISDTTKIIEEEQAEAFASSVAKVIDDHDGEQATIPLPPDILVRKL